MPSDINKAINITDGGNVESVISYMSNLGLKSESTGNNYKKAENMQNYCSDDT